MWGGSAKAPKTYSSCESLPTESSKGAWWGYEKKTHPYNRGSSFGVPPPTQSLYQHDLMRPLWRLQADGAQGSLQLPASAAVLASPLLPPHPASPVQQQRQQRGTRRPVRHRAIVDKLVHRACRGRGCGQVRARTRRKETKTTRDRRLTPFACRMELVGADLELALSIFLSRAHVCVRACAKHTDIYAP